MSGAEVVGLISGIVSIVDAIVKIHEAIQSTSGLPSSFHNVALRLPLLRESLVAAQEGIKGGAHEGSYSALERVLKSCEKKAGSLERKFRAMRVEPNSSKARRCIVSIRALKMGGRVEELMDSILDDMQLLIGNYAIQAATRTQVQDLVMEMREMRKMREMGEDAACPARSHYPSMNNYGTGLQGIHTGELNQNINTGSGSQLSGNFSGPLHFYSHG